MYSKCFRRTLWSLLIASCMSWAISADAQYSNYPANNNSGQQQGSSMFNNSNSNGTNNQQMGLRNRTPRSRNSRYATDNQNQTQTTTPENTRSSRGSSRNSNTATPQTPDTPQNAPGGAPSSPDGGLQMQGASGGSPSSANTRVGVRHAVPTVTIRQNALLYLEASSTIGIINQPLTVSVVLSNKKNIEFDRFAFLLQYNTQDLMLASEQNAEGKWVSAESLTIPAVNSTSISSASEEDEGKSLSIGDPSKFKIVQNTVDAQKGLIRFEFTTVKKPVSFDGTILNLTFVPLRENSTNVSFLFIDSSQRDPQKEPRTCVSLAGEDQLGTRFSQADGVINLDLQIVDSLEKARQLPTITKSGEKKGDVPEDGSPIELSLVPRKSDVNVGDIVKVDVVLSNPDKKAFDSLNLLIAFNPRVFEAVDGDETASGINLSDKDYKERFSLDFPVLNIVDKDKGIIDYRKKTMRKPCRSQGVLATIQLRAIRPTKKTTFRLFLSETGKEPTTGLSFRFQDRLGDPADPFDGVKTCSLAVRPTTAYLENLNR